MINIKVILAAVLLTLVSGCQTVGSAGAAGGSGGAGAGGLLSTVLGF
ncbi:MAG: hypothetical protein WCK65_00085 [Rhodospirillaceae bacterium]